MRKSRNKKKPQAKEKSGFQQKWKTIEAAAQVKGKEAPALKAGRRNSNQSSITCVIEYQCS